MPTPSTAKRYEFEGQMRTVREIRGLVPCLSDSTIRIYLRAGMKTRREMTVVNTKAARARGGVKGCRSAKRNGFG